MRAMAGWGTEASGRAARVWAGALAVASLAIGARNRDGEAIVFGVLLLVVGQLTRVRKGTVGRIVLGLLAADSAGWMLPAVFVNARDGNSLGGVLVPGILAVLSLGLLALVIGLHPTPVLGMGVLLLVLAVAGSVVASGRDRAQVMVDATLRARNAAFDRKVVTVRTGALLVVRNDDLFWHTFTVPDLHIDARLATQATRTVSLDVPAGSYRFVCAIPGHDQAGMNGTLIVE
jgi:plastocyanin